MSRRVGRLMSSFNDRGYATPTSSSLELDSPTEVSLVEKPGASGKESLASTAELSERSDWAIVKFVASASNARPNSEAIG